MSSSSIAATVPLGCGAKLMEIDTVDPYLRNPAEPPEIIFEGGKDPTQKAFPLLTGLIST